MTAQTEAELVKVVITSFNRSAWLSEAVDSVLDQTHKQMHVVIVDDASTDGSGDLARAYAAAHPARVTAIVKRQNGGLADTLVLGIGAGPEAPFVAFLNEDDRWHPRKLERQLEVFRQEPQASLVFTDAEVIDVLGQTTGSLYSDLYGRIASGDFSEMLRRHYCCASTLMIRREVAERAARSLRDAQGACDLYLTALAASRHPILEVHEPLAGYRFSESAMHINAVRMGRMTLHARKRLFANNPELSALLGGPKRVRRTLALCALDDAVLMVYRRKWPAYRMYLFEIMKQRSVRTLLWLPIHTLRVLRQAPEPFVDDIVARAGPVER